ncbi:MAG TPA: 3-oxoacyl-[acyl-carrier-protein] synthase III C-terminal domain-containing protein [Myxococcales bacterium]|jgi:alkylresorcinol/alkylpyrone synthase
MTQIAAVGRALPEHYYDQEQLLAALRSQWAPHLFNLARLEQIHRNVLVGGRHLALPMEEYPRLRSFKESNAAYIRCATELGASAVSDVLAKVDLPPTAIDHLFFVSVTGIATPSIDARLVNRLELRTDIKRTPIFGLGCVAGAAGIARAVDYLRAYPEQAAVVLSVELCSLTLQPEDFSVPNLIASGLFGDGAAAVLLLGEHHPAATRTDGPTVRATQSTFYRGTEGAMGWEITERGFKIVLSDEVPRLIGRMVRGDVERLLTAQGLKLADVASYVSHPGGPKILKAVEEALSLPPEALALSWKHLAAVGNMSSASVLMVLGDTIAERRPQPGAAGLLFAMGPGFCSELVLLEW